MHRWIARFLLVLSLVGILAPAALAIGTPPPHACCVRKGMHCHTPPEAQFQTPGCCGHDCYRSLTVSQFAEYSPAVSGSSIVTTAIQTIELRIAHASAHLDASHSGRAPPALSLP
jgi:hypothetical protein